MTYIHNKEEIDFSDIAAQNKMHALNDAISECKWCQKGWHQQHSLKAWYADFTNWVSIGYCSLVTPATIPGQKIVLP